MQSIRVGCERSRRQETSFLPTNSIEPGQFAVRSTLGDIDGLKESILQHGLLSPIIVREIEPSRYEVVAGMRRLRAFEQLGFPEIPSEVIEANDKVSLETSLTENVQRQTLDPLDEARVFYRYVTTKEKHGFGYGSVSELARRIGKSQEYVSNRIGLLRLPESTLRQLFDERKLSVSHVEELASLSANPEAVEELASLIASRRISVRVLENAVHLIKTGLETRRAIELAEIESDMGLESDLRLQDDDRVHILISRAKRVLETTLSYLDNITPELKKDPRVYTQWLESVRLPVHKAIDGAIVCQKNASHKNYVTRD